MGEKWFAKIVVVNIFFGAIREFCGVFKLGRNVFFLLM